MTKFATTRGRDKEPVYLFADSIEEIETYCEQNDLTIIATPEYVDPNMVCHHFLWIGEGEQPPLWKISKPKYSV